MPSSSRPMAAWQQIDVGGHKVANDHSDRDYDEKIITRAAKLVERLKRIGGALGDHDPRFRRYGERFDAALDRVDRGQPEYLSSPGLESVHDIWFEFHEDLLRSLARRARSEPMSSVDHDSPVTARWVYSFEDADPEDVALLGGKGAGLARMSRAGRPSRPASSSPLGPAPSTSRPESFQPVSPSRSADRSPPLSRRPGEPSAAVPFPCSFRCVRGAPVAMPGMMETILNLGIGRDAAVALAEATGEPEFVLDVTRRLQKGFSEVVLGSDPDVVDEAVANFALRADGTPFAETFDRYWERCRQAWRTTSAWRYRRTHGYSCGWR